MTEKEAPAGAATHTAPPPVVAASLTSAETSIRSYAQLFERMILGLGQQNMALHQQVSALSQQIQELAVANVGLRHALEDAPAKIGKLPHASAETPIQKLMSINAQMYEGTCRVLDQQNLALHQQASELRQQAHELAAVNVKLHHDLEEAAALPPSKPPQ